ncbi:UNVERIFIED_CONTAM: Membrane-associated protein, chloroplastic [Sesamum radiatum]|uniref:Membrane-associated protein, chloroplastic n=1 Tax=Sesamum radiatum TaxID=300843 RepID=A0AAW2NCH8_SESRA
MIMAVRAPIAGMSMASSTVTPSPNGGVIVVKALPLRRSFFGHGVKYAIDADPFHFSPFSVMGLSQVLVLVIGRWAIDSARVSGVSRGSSVKDLNLFVQVECDLCTPKYGGMRLSDSSISRCKSHGGGVLGTQMNLFDRFARVVKKILEQTVIEMNDDLIKMRQATAQVLASQKQLENKYKAAQQASEDWYRRAQLALGRVMRTLLVKLLNDNANALKAQLDQQKSVVDNLVSNTRLLESKIQEAKSKKDTLKARAQSAKFVLALLYVLLVNALGDLLGLAVTDSLFFRTATKVSEMLGNVNTSSALSAFEKMEEKVLAMESQAEALNQLTSDELEGKFALLETSSVDDDLASLKKELSGSTKFWIARKTSSAFLESEGRASAGRPVSSALKFQDPEIEKELNELRQKAKEY